MGSGIAGHGRGAGSGRGRAPPDSVPGLARREGSRGREPSPLSPKAAEGPRQPALPVAGARSRLPGLRDRRCVRGARAAPPRGAGKQ